MTEVHFTPPTGDACDHSPPVCGGRESQQDKQWIFHNAHTLQRV